MTGLLYTVFIGIPFCVFMCAIGIMLCCTIILAPFGLTMIALGVKGLTLAPRSRVVVR